MNFKAYNKIVLALLFLLMFSCFNLIDAAQDFILDNVIAGLKSPYGVCADNSGNIYIADTGNHKIQIYDEWQVFQKEIGAGELNSPQSVAIDSLGQLIVCDTGNHLVKIFDIASGAGTGFVGNSIAGPLNSALGNFNFPRDIAVDSSGNIYIADSGNNRIQKFDSAGVFIAEIKDVSHPFDHPYSVDIDISGKIYIADTYNHSIKIFNSDNTFYNEFGYRGTGDGPDISGNREFELLLPQGITVDQNYIYIADSNNARIKVFDNLFPFAWVQSYGHIGNNKISFHFPRKIFFLERGNYDKLFIADSNLDRVQIFNLSSLIYSISLDRKYFSPQGSPIDPLYVNSTMDYSIAENTKVSLSILNSMGERKKDIIFYEERLAGTYSYTWDGTDDNGDGLPEGIYTYEIIANNTMGGPNIRKTETVIIDNSPPIFSISEKYIGEGSDDIEIHYASDDNFSDEIENLILEVKYLNADGTEGALIKGIKNIDTEDTGSYKVVWDRRNSSGILIPNNTKIRYKIMANDLAKNQVISYLDSIVDDTPPEILGLNISRDIIRSGGEPTEIRFSASDNISDQVWIIVTIEDKNGSEISALRDAWFSGTKIPNSFFSLDSWNGYSDNNPGVPLETEYYTYRIIAYDEKFNKSEVTGTIGVDNIPPVTSISYDNTAIILPSGEIGISGYSKIFLSAQDPGIVRAGEKGTYFQREGEADFQSYISDFTIPITVDSTRWLKFYSDDNVENIEIENTKIFRSYNYFISKKYRANIEPDTGDDDYADHKRDGVLLKSFGVGELTDGKSVPDIDIGNDGFFDFIVWNSDEINDKGYLDLTFDMGVNFELDRFIFDAWRSADEYISRIEILGSDVDGSHQKIDDIFFDDGTGAGDLYSYQIAGLYINNRYIKFRIYVVDNDGDGLGLRLHEARAYGVNINTTIAGKINSADTGMPVFGAIVTAVRADGLTASTYSKADGTYEIEKLPGGDYTVWAKLTEYSPKYSYNSGIPFTIVDDAVQAGIDILIPSQNLFLGKLYKANTIDKIGYRDDKREGVAIISYGKGELADGDIDIKEFDDYVGWDYATARKSSAGKLEIEFNLGVANREIEKIIVKGVYNNDGDNDDNFIKEIEVYGSDDGVNYTSAPVGRAVFGYESLVDNDYDYVIGGINKKYKFIKLAITSESYSDWYCLIHEIEAYGSDVVSTKGGVFGRITYSDNTSVENAIVSLKNTSDNYTVTVNADVNGNFQFNNVPAGSYDIYSSIGINSPYIEENNSITVNDGDVVNEINLILPRMNVAVGKEYVANADFYSGHPTLGYAYLDRLRSPDLTTSWEAGEITDGKTRLRQVDPEDYIAWSSSILGGGTVDLTLSLSFDMENQIGLERLIIKGDWPVGERTIKEISINAGDSKFDITTSYCIPFSLNYNGNEIGLDIIPIPAADFQYYQVIIKCDLDNIGVDIGNIISEIEMYEYDAGIRTVFQVALTVEPEIVLTGGNTATIKGQIQDIDGNDIRQAGISIALNTTLGSFSGGPGYTTDGNGQFEVEFVSGAVFGTANITASFAGTTAITVIDKATASGVSLSLVPTGDMALDDTKNIEINLIDASDNPVSLGNPVLVRLNEITGLGILGDYEFTTDGAVPFVTTFNPGTKTGLVQIVASSPGLNSDNVSFNINVSASPTKRLVLSATPLEVRANGKAQSQIIVSLEDEYGNPILNEIVNITFAPINNGTIEQADPNTGLDGKAYAVYTADEDFNPVTITASASGYIDDSVIIQMLESDLPHFTIMISREGD